MYFYVNLKLNDCTLKFKGERYKMLDQIFVKYTSLRNKHRNTKNFLYSNKQLIAIGLFIGFITICRTCKKRAIILTRSLHIYLHCPQQKPPGEVCSCPNLSPQKSQCIEHNHWTHWSSPYLHVVHTLSRLMSGCVKFLDLVR